MHTGQTKSHVKKAVDLDNGTIAPCELSVEVPAVLSKKLVYVAYGQRQIDSCVSVVLQ